MYGTVIYPVVMYSSLMVNSATNGRCLVRAAGRQTKKQRQVEIVVPCQENCLPVFLEKLVDRLLCTKKTKLTL